MSKAFARIFWSIAGLLLATAIVFAVISVVQLSSAVRTQGRLLDFDSVQNAIPYTEQDSGIQNYPIIGFSDADGVARQFVSPRPVSPERYVVGQTIDILIVGPDTVLIDSFLGIWGRSLVFLGTAFLFFIFGLGSLRSFDSKSY